MNLLLSESISNIHRGYFGLVNARRLDAAELTVSLLALGSRTELLSASGTRSAISLGYLALAHDVFFAVVLSACIHGTLARYLLLHGNR